MSSVLAELGAVIVDADVIAREVVEPGTEGLAALVDEFGDSILQADGSLDRPALAAVAFATDEARAAMNAIVHPLVGRRTMDHLTAAPADAIVVQDVPLLVEGGMGPAFNLVIVVHVDAEERVRRLVDLRGMPEADARARIAAQANDDARRAAADVWLDNSGSKGRLDSDVRALWTDRLLPFEANLHSRTPVSSRPVIVPANQVWPDQAERLMSRLRLACGATARRIDHIGSTAVPGLDARDVIDLQITVVDLAAADELAEALAGAGFPRVEHVSSDDPEPAWQGGETDPVVWEKRTHAGADPGRPVVIHIRVDGWPAQQFALLFRDWLRADALVREEYLGIKRAAAERAAGHGGRAEAIEAYVDAKAPWFDAAYRRAWEWAGRTGWSSH